MVKRMNISEVAKKTGLTAKSIRLYEQKGLIAPTVRQENGYRYYKMQDVDDLQLIARCRAVGFSLDECKTLLLLARDPKRSSAEVKLTAVQKLKQVQKKLNELTLIEQQLSAWISDCPGNAESFCPIINGLTGE